MPKGNRPGTRSQPWPVGPSENINSVETLQGGHDVSTTDVYPASEHNDSPRMQLSTRPPRKSKQSADKAWESLIPGRKRSKANIPDELDNDTEKPGKKTSKSGLPPLKRNAPLLPPSSQHPTLKTKNRKMKRWRPPPDYTASPSPAVAFNRSLGNYEDGPVVYTGGGAKPAKPRTQPESRVDKPEMLSDDDDPYKESTEDEYQSDSAEPTQEGRTDCFEDDEVEMEEDDIDDVRDEASLARQFEAERASWAGEQDEEEDDQEARTRCGSRDNFPAARTQPHASQCSLRPDEVSPSPAPASLIRMGSVPPQGHRKRFRHDSLHVSDLETHAGHDGVEISNKTSSAQPAKKRREADPRADMVAVQHPPKTAPRVMAPARSVPKLHMTVSHAVKNPTHKPASPALEQSYQHKAHATSKRRHTSASGRVANRDRARVPEKRTKPRARQSETITWRDGSVSDSDLSLLDASQVVHNTSSKGQHGGYDTYASGSDTQRKVLKDDDDSGSDDTPNAPDHPNDNDSIELVEPGPRLSLGIQRPRVRTVAKRAIDDVLLNVCLKNAFPEGPDKHNQFTRPTLIRIATELGFKDIARRLNSDVVYSRHLGSIPAQRISTFRGKVKKHTDGLVALVFGLHPGDALKVEWLDEKLNYIYPHEYKASLGKLTRNVKRNLPYKPPVFTQVMRAAWFSKPSAYGFKIYDHFTSSSLEAPREKEIPAPMLALAATAIYASITDYSAPNYKAGDFTGNSFLDVYARNMRALQKIREGDVGKYHVLMHGFFRELCGIYAGISGHDDDLDALDVDGMPDV
ncbi:hypothetical protein C8Q77DRAFT_1207724 [Trametes polyzona]|nr:hypothetical protein C8Q77DRAFT_1207724 [Trametes polyzona]